LIKLRSQGGSEGQRKIRANLLKAQRAKSLFGSNELLLNEYGPSTSRWSGVQGHPKQYLDTLFWFLGVRAIGDNLRALTERMQLFNVY